MTSFAIFCTLLLIGAFMLYHRTSLKSTTITLFLSLFILEFLDDSTNVLIWILLAIILIPLNLTELRSKYLSKPILKIFRQIMPSMSDTEKEALDAGTVWWEGELFRGKPHWQILHQYPAPSLSAEEIAFINGPVTEVCQMCDDWSVIHERKDLAPEVWQYLKDNKFFSMIIPKEYGGLEFSAIAQSEILVKLNSASGTLGSTVAVPNSLGPAELLLHYGTKEQKDYFLPRLANGEEIPCFALTNPEAGSDASSIPDYGVVVEKEIDGEKKLGIVLNFSKRYITLAPVATLVGLAFQLKDPDGLLGGDEDVGITCALLPRDIEGLVIGRRHIPLSTPFQNGPLQGKDVFITMDQIIGGQAMAGCGWRMLMDCLSAGRAISLPSAAAGGSLLGVATTTAYASIREQFKMPIGKMEGVEEFIARMTGTLYQVESARTMTAGSVDLGEKPAVPSAIVKYSLTERGRNIINDAMDVHAGKGIIMGPGNYLGANYMSAPIGITVEGANILTRSMIVYGQGAIRCHPHIVAEMTAASGPTSPENLRVFDKAIFGHIGFVMSNTVRTIWFGLTGSRLVISPFNDETAPYYRRLTRLSAALAFCSDMAMFMLGGDLKRREKVSGRFADLLSNLYIGSACLKRYDDQGRNKEDLPIVKLATEQAIYDAQVALSELLKNFPIRIAGRILHRVVFPFGRTYERPSDQLGHKVARLVMTPNEVRNRLVKSCFLDNSKPSGRLQTTLKMRFDAEPLLKKVKQSIEKSQYSNNFVEMGKIALEKGAIIEEEFKLLEALEERRLEVINVDDFDPRDY